MDIPQRLKDMLTILQFASAAVKATGELFAHVYNFVFPKSESAESTTKKSGEALSNALMSTQIIEEISVFKDENGETKTTISRKILKKVFTPDMFEPSNDNVPHVKLLDSNKKENSEHKGVSKSDNSENKHSENNEVVGGSSVSAAEEFG